MASRRVLITGGAGFLGSALSRRCIAEGSKVRILDNGYRHGLDRLGNLASRAEWVVGDIRDPKVVHRAARGVDTVYHLAYINGTRYFYEVPHLVLEVAVKGITNVLDAVLSNKVKRLVLVSSSEVYQTPSKVPTPEDVPLVVPNLENPRFSYGGGKIISELMAVNYARHFNFEWRVIRPHNVYGPHMGFDHVIPALIKRIEGLGAKAGNRPVDLPIEGNGRQTRAFCFIDDAVDGLLMAAQRGSPNGVYHLGTQEMVTIADLAHRIARRLGVRIRLRPGPAPVGGTLKRCPDISKLRRLGYRPRVTLDEGLKITCEQYLASMKSASTS